jgi:hypothetical protein
MAKQAAQVFGVSTSVLDDSYVDRGKLDSEIARLLRRNTHIAIRGPSKSGKSWLRQRRIPKAITIQCRLGKTVQDIYREALGQLGVKLILTEGNTTTFSGSVESSTELGVGLIAKVQAKLGLSGTAQSSKQRSSLRQNIDDLDFVAKLIIESGRRLVIEDFHYLNADTRRHLAFDLKAFWDLGLYVVIIGVWGDNNLLLHLNSDLAGRVAEVSIEWNEEDLAEVLRRGSTALNITIEDKVARQLVELSYGNAGILQRLTLAMLDQAGISERYPNFASIQVGSAAFVDEAARAYADELNSVYQTFASRIAGGIRTRADSTHIYVHALATVLAATDTDLINGISVAAIFQAVHARQSRIQMSHLRTALGKFEALQVDDDGRGLILAYADDKIRLVDRQLLLYRRYTSASWPWGEALAQQTGPESIAAAT